MSEWSGPVLFFDGECGLCNRLTRVLLRLDDEGRLRFARLQGSSAQAYLRAHGLPTEDFDTLIFVPAWGARAEPAYRVRTAGAIGALRAIGGGARMAGDALALIPAPLRDLGYKLVARTRYALFGPWKPQPLARPEWRELFLD